MRMPAWQATLSFIEVQTAPRPLLPALRAVHVALLMARVSPATLNQAH